MKMRQFENLSVLISKVMVFVFLSAGLLAMRSSPVSLQERSRPETESRSVQTCENRLANFEYSTVENRQVVVQAFEKGRNQGLVNVPSWIQVVGKISFMSGSPTRLRRCCG